MDNQDIHLWVIKVIKSCTTLSQLLACKKLINNYDIMYNNIDGIVDKEIIMMNSVENLKYFELTEQFTNDFK
jgi:hypothetical protein